MESAILNGTDIEGASLVEANLSGAKYNPETRWPKGFDPEASGAVLVGGGELSER